MKLHIGPLRLALSGVTEQEIPVNSCLFIDRENASEEVDRHYTFHFVDRLPLPTADWQVVFRRKDIVVFQQGELEARLLAVGQL